MVHEVNTRSVVVQGLSILIICSLIQICAGKVLETMKEYFISLLPGLVVIVPPLLGLRGNICGALASRLGTGLNAGLIEPRLIMSTAVRINLASSLILSVITSVTLGIFAFGMNLLTGVRTIGLYDFISISVIAGSLSGLISSLLTVLVAIKAYSHGLDPDNITSPAMTAVNDFVVVACIYLAILLVA